MASISLNLPKVLRLQRKLRSWNPPCSAVAQELRQCRPSGRVFGERATWLVIKSYAGGIFGYFGCVDADDIEPNA